MGSGEKYFLGSCRFLQTSFVYTVNGQESLQQPNVAGKLEDFMCLRIETEKTGEVAVLQCTGRIVREALYLLKQAVTGLSRLRFIVLDLSEVDLIDAGGLGVLVFLHNWTSVKGIQLKLVNPSRQVRQMLELTGLISVFHISSVGDVIEMFCCPDRANENMNRAVARAIVPIRSVQIASPLFATPSGRHIVV